MSTIVMRQVMWPAVVCAAGLSMFVVSFLPNVQRQAPSYSAVVPLATTPYGASALPVMHPPIRQAPLALTRPSSKPTAKASPLPLASTAAKVSPAPLAKASPKVAAGKKKGAATTASKPVKPGTGSTTADADSGAVHQVTPATMGRDDPFKSLLEVAKPSTLPPPPPTTKDDQVPGGLPLAVEKPVADVTPTVAPTPPPNLRAGLRLKGLVSGDDEPAAIISVDGTTQLVRMGDVIRRFGYIVTITHINEAAMSITISDGKGNTDVLETE